MPEEKSVERYVVGPDLEHPGFCRMHPAESGGWVPWDDYARLQARLKEVEGELDREKENAARWRAGMEKKLRELHEFKERLTSDRAIEAVVDFLGSWSYCAVAQAKNPSHSCVEDAARQFLAAIDAASQPSGKRTP